MRDVGVIEGDSSLQYMRFLVTLDRPATAPVTFTYFTEGVTAAGALGDFQHEAQTVTIPAGQQTTYIDIPVYGDPAVEGNETLQIVLTDVANAVFDGNAPVLVATGTILDDDGGVPSPDAGVGGFGTGVSGPASAGPLPTLTIHDTTLIEGDGSLQYARFLMVFDRPITADVTLSYYVQDGTAAEGSDDMQAVSRTVTWPPGPRAPGWMSPSAAIPRERELLGRLHRDHRRAVPGQCRGVRGNRHDPRQ